MKALIALLSLLGGTAVFGQVQSYEAPSKTLRAVIIPVGAPGFENHESRVEIRASSGTLLRRRNFASRDHNHGEGVSHAAWTSDERFFVFTTSNSGGHQPWRVATYFYSVREQSTL